MNGRIYVNLLALHLSKQFVMPLYKYSETFFLQKSQPNPKPNTYNSHVAQGAFLEKKFYHSSGYTMSISILSKMMYACGQTVLFIFNEHSVIAFKFEDSVSNYFINLNTIP